MLGMFLVLSTSMIMITSATGYPENQQIDIEQAHFTYGLENGVSFTIGKYGSKLGFEREDPSGIYTYSRAYQDYSEWLVLLSILEMLMHMFTKVQQFPITEKFSHSTCHSTMRVIQILKMMTLIQNFLFPTQESKTWS